MSIERKYVFLQILIVVALSSLLCLFGFAQEEVYVGVIFPRTGPGARLGETAINAAIMAAEDINAAGGIKALGGAKIIPIIGDTETDPKMAVSVTQRLIAKYPITAFNGAYYSGHTIPASEVSERSKIPWLTASISDMITARGYKYIFQVAPKASHFGHMQVVNLRELDKQFGTRHNKMGIVYENTAYGTDTAGGIKEKCKELGYDVVLFEAYKAGFTDAGPLVSKIKASGAEILFPVSYVTDSILILRTLRKLDCNVAVIGGGAGYLMPVFYKSGERDAEYVISVGSWNYDLPYPEVKDFADRYRKKYVDFMQEQAGEAYVIMWIIKEACEIAKSSDPIKVRDALTKIDLREGPGSCMPGHRVQFDETGWNKWVHPVMVQWQKGDLRCIWPPDSASIEPAWPVPTWSERE
ncbi:MAG: ABC transporter substrate-binding protein [Candidatus Atribacteria bacterium]